MDQNIDSVKLDLLEGSSGFRNMVWSQSESEHNFPLERVRKHAFVGLHTSNMCVFIMFYVSVHKHACSLQGRGTVCS